MSKAIARREVTDVGVFQPTDKMEEYLNTAVMVLSDSPSKIEKQCEVTRKSWYFWLKTVPGFEDWFYSEYRRLRQRIIPKLDEMGMKYADRGSFQHWEAMNRKVGELVGEDAPQNVQQVIVQVPEAFAKKYEITPEPGQDS